MKILLPKNIKDVITNQVNKDPVFGNADQQIKHKIVQKSLNLWYFILDRQINDIECISLNYYTHISKTNLDVKDFTVKFNRKRYFYTKFLEILSPELITINNNYLFCSANSANKGFTKSYRVNAYYLHQASLEETEIDISSITKSKIKDQTHWTKIYPEYSHLIKDSYGTTIELQSYSDWLNANIGKSIPGILKKESWLNDVSHFEVSIFRPRVLDAERVIRYTNAALKHNLGHLWFKISNEGRFYSSLTSLSTTAIPFMKLNGCTLQSLDIANCQPLLLSGILANEQFRKDCGAGVFYQRIMDKTGKDKAEVKCWLYKYLLFNNKPLNTGNLFSCLQELYPGLVDEINELKEQLSLAHHLQAMEADIIVKGVGALPIPKLLRHDQVLVHTENYSIVEAWIRKVFAENGLQVTFR